MAKPETSDVESHRVHLVHLTSSRFFGGPERQMLELARELAPEIPTTFISFSEGGLCESFLREVRQSGFPGIALQHDTPQLFAAANELRLLLRSLSPSGEQGPSNEASSSSLSPRGGEGQGEGGLSRGEAPSLPRSPILCVHGYKAGLLGLWAARRCGIPVIAVSRGWTGESFKVRCYEWLDRRILRFMDRVVCVSHAQAERVRAAGVPETKIEVIHNAIRVERFAERPDPADRKRLEAHFPKPPTFLMGAAGRLSPEKGFDVLIDACDRLRRGHPEIDFGLIVFGEGPLRAALEARARRSNSNDRIVLAGFTRELDRWLPHLDLFVQSSHTEGLPNVLLEAAAAGVPAVATDVGGTSEIVVNRQTGLLVPANSPLELSNACVALANSSQQRSMLAARGVRNVVRCFSTTTQAQHFRELFAPLCCRRRQAR